MKITAIEQQKKEGRYNIFLDGEFAFGLYKDTIYDFGLRVNDEITEKKAKEIIEYDEVNFGKKVALRFLNYKPRTEKEVITKLKEKKLSEENIEKVLIYLREFKFVDDEKYAQMFVEEKINYSPTAKRVITQKLISKGINKKTAEVITEENYSVDKEFKKAFEIRKKYEKKVRYKNEMDKKQKVFRYLLSKGFSYDLINDVMNHKEE